MDRQWSCTPSRHSVKANWNRNQRWRSRIWAGVSTRCRTSCLIRCTAWWHILTWAWGTSGGGFNNCYRGRRGGGRDGEGEGRGGKEDIYVLLTEWRRKGNKIHARGQKRGKKEDGKKKRTGNGHKSSPCVKDWCRCGQTEGRPDMLIYLVFSFAPLQRTCVYPD